MSVRRRLPLCLLLALGCGPAWGPPSGQEPHSGSHRLEPDEFCEPLSQYGQEAVLAEASRPPHALPQLNVVVADHPANLRSSVRDVFAPRGYFHFSNESGQGLIGIGKKLSETTSVTARFDVGTLDPSASGLAFVSIGDDYTVFRLPPSREAANQSQYPLVDSATWRRLLEPVLFMKGKKVPTVSPPSARLLSRLSRESNKGGQILWVNDSLLPFR
jgi:hypothetical protein